MCYIISKSDVASSLSRLTGKGYENSFMDLNRFNKPSAFNSWGTFDIRGFGTLARSEGASDLSIVNEVSRTTGKSFENSFLELNRISLKSFKKT
jgi:hypothetical protein